MHFDFYKDEMSRPRKQKGGRTYASVQSISRTEDGGVEMTVRCHGFHPKRMLQDKPGTVYIAWGSCEHEWTKSVE